MSHSDTEHATGCCDEGRSFSLSRRTLFKGLAAGAAAVPLAGMLGESAAYAAATDPSWTGDVLVVLSLRGGFDGLSAFVPTGDPYYGDPVYGPPPPGSTPPRDVNTGIGIPQSALKIVDTSDLTKNSTGTVFGLHPSLSPLYTLFDNGQFGAVVAAGLPAPNRSHFDATDEVEQAIPGSLARTGWLDRLLGAHYGAVKPLWAVQMGSSTMPTSYLGSQPAVGMNSLNSFSLSGTNNSTRPSWRAALTTLHSRAGADVRASANDTLGALDAASIVASMPSGAGYPNSGTANALKDIARLIKNNAAQSLGLKVVTLDVGNWDMHVGLGRWDNSNDWMTRQLKDLASSLAAFAADLGPLLNSTTLVTMSEFGRRVGQNDSGGVDHGWGNQMMLLGGKISGGIRGTWLGLNHLTQGDVTVTTDYRTVFADILKNSTENVPADIQPNINAVFPVSTLNVTAAGLRTTVQIDYGAEPGFMKVAP